MVRMDSVFIMKEEKSSIKKVSIPKSMDTHFPLYNRKPYEKLQYFL